MKNLFVIYIGGACEGSLIETHDIRLVISDTIENTFDELRKSWWGKPETLHLDVWGVLNWADGYQIKIVESNNKKNQKNLYFINLGGYDSKQFTEIHKNIFIVADNEQEAKSRALQHIADWECPHKDYLFDVDKILDVNSLVNNRVQLIPCAQEVCFDFKCQYIPIGK